MVVSIKIVGRVPKDVNGIAQQIIDIAKTVGVKHRGPIPLPTKRMKIAVRKTPRGDGSHTFDHWEMNIHKKLLYIDNDDQALRQIMRIPVPDTVQIEMNVS